MEQRLCPCGARLVRKANESQARFEERKYCNSQHRGKYHNYGPAERGFGIEIPKDKTRRRVGLGMMGFLYGRPDH